MSVFDALVLGIIQGITEFLPISSSGHLLIFEKLFGLQIETLRTFDVAVHLGTLTAILIYFWKDIWTILKGFFTGRDMKFGWYIILGSIPAGVAGFLLNDIFDQVFRSIFVVGIGMICVGLIFFAAEKWPKDKNKNVSIWWNAVLIGIAQAIAIIPGVSRSGSTIAAGLFQGIKREEAARFSFLLGSVSIFGAGLLTFLSDNSEKILLSTLYFLLSGFFASTIAGFLTISFLMKFLKKYTLRGFGVYLVLIGIVCLSGLL